MGCDTGSGTDGGSAVTYSDWQIKGSTDNWAEHQFAVDEIDANKLTYTIDVEYADAVAYVITSYSIHYTKLYDRYLWHLPP